MIPVQYLEQAKATISVLNSVEHAENSLRTYLRLVQTKPMVIKVDGLFTPKKMFPVPYIEEQTKLALKHIKEINSVLVQTHTAAKGTDQIQLKQYEYVQYVDKLYLLCNEDQQKVFELIEKLTQQNNANGGIIKK